jgi:hypothetical protein
MFFDLAFSDNREISFISFTNVFYTLFLGAACCMIYSSLKSKKRAWLFLLPVALIPLAVLSQFFIQDINSIITWDVIRAAFIIYTAAVLFLCGRLPEANPGKNVLPRRILALVIIIPLIMLADILDTDYGMTGVIFIILFYLAKPENRVFRTAAMTVAVFLQYAYPYIVPKVLEAYGFWLPGILPGSMSFRQNLNEFWFAMAAAPLVFFYNGKQGHKFKWAFYAFYPVHIAALAFIRSLIA